MSTFGELYTEVLTRLSEQSSPQFWTQAELYSYINRGYREFYKRSRYKTVMVPLTLAESGRYYRPYNGLLLEGVYFNRKPLDRKTVRALEARYSGTGHFSNLRGDGADFGSDFRADTTTDNPIAWYYEDARICVYPIPSTIASVSEVRTKQTGTLSSGTTNITLSTAITTDENYVDVFLGGVWQNSDQWTIPNTTTVAMGAAQYVDLAYEVVARPATATTSTRTVKELFSMAAGETLIRLSRGYTVGTNALSISINGVAQASTEWTETGAYTVTLTTALAVASEVEVSITYAETGVNAEALVVPAPVAMTAGAETPDIEPDEYHDALWEWAVHEALTREGRGKDLEKGAYYLQRFMARVDDFKRSFHAADGDEYPEVPFFV